MADKITPEEKLLKLIETPSSDGKAAGPKFKKIPLPSLKNVVAHVWGGREKIAAHVFNLKFVNQSLMVVSSILAVYLILDFIKGKPNMSKIYARNGGDAAKMIFKIRPVAQEAKLLNLSDYINQVKQRDVFHFTPLKKEEEKASEKDTFISLTSNFKLVGIIWSNHPQAMIEDKKENKTLLVNPGDSIGDLKVKEILKDKVILGYEGQEMELL